MNRFEAHMASGKTDSVNSIRKTSIVNEPEATHTVKWYYEKIQLAKCRRNFLGSQYYNFNFIAANLASVERLLCTATWILTCLLKKMFSILFETILFSKLNLHLFDVSLVLLAMNLKKLLSIMKETVVLMKMSVTVMNKNICFG